MAHVVRDQGAALDEITIVKAFDAMRKQDFDKGLALARQVFLETSTSSSDHLALGRLYMTAGRSVDAGKEFRRAVEFGPGVPGLLADLRPVPGPDQANRSGQGCGRSGEEGVAGGRRHRRPPRAWTSACRAGRLYLGNDGRGSGVGDQGRLRLRHYPVLLSHNRLDQVE